MKNLSKINKYADVTGFGIEMAVSMVLPVLLGVYLDRHFNVSPWGVLLGVFFGIAAVASRLYKLMVMFDKGKKRNKNNE
jgi:F0F1-type ATP synthase assembly protein I